MKTLILVRHCQSDWNAIKRLSGQDDTARLNEEGKGQAIKLGMQLLAATSEFSHIVCSDLERAQQTAHFLREALNVPILTEPRFREVHLGSLDGKTREEILSTDRGRELLDSLHRAYDFREFGGECSDTVLDRHLKAVEEALKSCPDGCTMVVVGHGSSLRTLLRHYHPDRDLHAQGGYDSVLI
ncbi:histidine phosphatase family protein [Candidatus Uhrbacteria bacterium]|nr:MAG: histidine phosphatase family protein [Candidatus Uhrbacteria bacterium]